MYETAVNLERTEKLALTLLNLIDRADGSLFCLFQVDRKMYKSLRLGNIPIATSQTQSNLIKNYKSLLFFISTSVLLNQHQKVIVVVTGFAITTMKLAEIDSPFGYANFAKLDRVDK